MQTKTKTKTKRTFLNYTVLPCLLYLAVGAALVFAVPQGTATAASVSAPCDEVTATCSAEPESGDTVDDRRRCHSTVNRYLIESGPNAGSRCRIRTCTKHNLVTGQVTTTDQPVDCVKPAVTQ